MLVQPPGNSDLESKISYDPQEVFND